MEITNCRNILRKLIISDKIIYGGASAGAFYAQNNFELYQQIDESQKAPKQINKGLNLVGFALIPHWNNPEFQKPLEKIKRDFEKQNTETITITDNEALFVENHKRNKL